MVTTELLTDAWESRPATSTETGRLIFTSPTTRMSRPTCTCRLIPPDSSILPFSIGLDLLSRPYVGFGTKALDIDRNGWLDLMVTNGHIFDMRHAGEGYQMPPQMLMLSGAAFEQAEVEDPSGYWEGSFLGRTVASLDFDRDDRIDFVVGHLDAPAALLRNETETSGGFIQFELVGTVSERDAVGARLTVDAGGQEFAAWVTAGDGYFCTDEAVLDLGLGEQADTVTVVVAWPSGLQQTFSDLSAGHRYLIVEGEAEVHRRR